MSPSAESIKNALAQIFVKAKVSADVLTLAGLVAGGAAGALLYKGRWAAGAVFLLSSGVFDLLDGAVARQSGKKSIFGGILDSSMDRYGDSFIFGGILFYYTAQANFFYAAIAFGALVGAYAISYVRARTECERVDCRVGFWERGERLGCLFLGLVFGNLPTALGLLVLGTHWTALQRLARARGRSIPLLDRTRPVYYWKAAIVAGILAFFRL